MDGQQVSRRRLTASSPAQTGEETEGTGELFGYEGEELRVTYGKEHFQPARFQGMDVGPFEMSTRIRAGETPLQAKRRVMALLERMAEEEYKEKLPRFLERVRNAESYL